ncbi:MAG: hypothetical protein J6M12_04085 [Clostridia bacterium]|nr:hypothetical protein [Clostridia bacterium]
MKFCPECGSLLVNLRFCPECGENISKYLDSPKEAPLINENKKTFPSNTPPYATKQSANEPLVSDDAPFEIDYLSFLNEDEHAGNSKLEKDEPESRIEVLLSSCDSPCPQPEEEEDAEEDEEDEELASCLREFLDQLEKSNEELDEKELCEEEDAPEEEEEEENDEDAEDDSRISETMQGLFDSMLALEGDSLKMALDFLQDQIDILKSGDPDALSEIMKEDEES